MSGRVSQRRGKPSNRRLPEEVKDAGLSRVRECYRDFGPTLAAESLRDEGLRVSKERLRSWLIEAGMWKGGKGRRLRRHPPRARRPRLGELVRIDGSPHEWFEGRWPRCTLIAFIDEATSRVMHAHFAPVESTQAYLDALRAYVGSYGRPEALYSDRHGIFTKHDPEDGEPTQFRRAIGALGIAGIQALTPQAKGRVERLFQTLQDRLVKALRLAGIDDMAAANVFLPAYLARHNARFAVPPTDAEDAHLHYDGGDTALARICALQHRRRLSKDLALSFKRQRYLLQTGGRSRYALRGQSVTVVEYPDGRVELLCGEEVLPFKVFDEPCQVMLSADDKTLNARVGSVLEHRHWDKKYRPAPEHPWRKPFKPPLSGGRPIGRPP